MRGLESLKHLDLTDAYLGEIEAEAFGDLRGHKSLVLSSRDLSTTLHLAKLNGNLDGRHLPGLEELTMGFDRELLTQIGRLPSVRILRYQTALQFDDAFVSKFPNLEEIDLSGSQYVFPTLPTRFSSLTKLRVFRANDLWNGGPYGPKWPRHLARLLRSLQTIEVCHKKHGEHEIRYLAQELQYLGFRLTLRGKAHCQGAWIETHT